MSKVTHLDLVNVEDPLFHGVSPTLHRGKVIDNYQLEKIVVSAGPANKDIIALQQERDDGLPDDLIFVRGVEAIEALRDTLTLLLEEAKADA